jgi:hypothetical protein
MFLKRSACVVAGREVPLDIEFVLAQTIFGLEKAVVDPVVPDLQAECIFHVAAKPSAESRVACV